MAVEIGAERVPIVQKQLIHVLQRARRAGHHGDPDAREHDLAARRPRAPKPATSPMPSSTAPTAVMLSGGNRFGPVSGRSRRTHGAHRTRSRALDGRLLAAIACSSPIPGSVVDAIEHSALEDRAQQVGAVAIACLTHSGMAARTLAKYRPEAPIVAIMDDEADAPQARLRLGRARHDDSRRSSPPTTSSRWSRTSCNPTAGPRPKISSS